MMGRLRPKPATADSASTIALPQVGSRGGMPLMEALAARRSSREFSPEPLPPPLLGGLLWAAYGINRPEGGRTAPTAVNAQEIDVFAALPTGAHLYDAAKADAQLTLLHVVELPPASIDEPTTPSVDLALVRDATAANARHKLHALIPEQARTYCTVATLVVEGRAYREVLRQATDDDAALPARRRPKEPLYGVMTCSSK